MKQESENAISLPTPIAFAHLPNDVVEIEGVKYSGNFFRTLAMPDPESTYRFRRTADGAVFIERQNP